MNDGGTDLAFIVGHYKSGSTWLLNLLSLHPAIRGVQETHIFDHTERAPDLRACTRTLFSRVPWSKGGRRNLVRRRLLAWSRPFLTRLPAAVSLAPADRPAGLLDLTCAERRALRQGLLHRPSPDDYCRYFFGFLSEALHPQRYLLEKTPQNIFYVARIKRLFPRAKLLAIYRDGRDVVVSDRFFTSAYRRRGSWSFDASVLAWRRAIEAQTEVAATQAMFTCSYESLVRHGRTVVGALFEFLDLPPDAVVVEDVLHRSSFHYWTGREPGQESRRRFARNGAVGDWQNHFTAAEKSRFKALAGDLLVALGYERDLDW